MNILPLVLALLLMLSLSAATFFQEQLSTRREQKNYSGYMAAERLARNAAEKRAYARAEKAIKGGSSEKQEKKKKEISYESPREKRILHDAAKLNLSSFLSEKELTKGPIYQTAVKLIHQLYNHAPFFIEGKKQFPELEEDLLNLILIKGKENLKSNSFSSFYQSKDALSSIFYQMLQGTNVYDTKNKKGYPPFEDFFILDPNRSAVTFAFASTPLLTALLNAEIAQKIRDEEKARWEMKHKHHTLKKSELEKLLLPYANQGVLQVSAMDKWVSFSKKTGPKSTLSASDPETGITVRRR